MIEARLRELGIVLPEPLRPAFNYVPVVVWDGLAYVSGQLPRVDGQVPVPGRVGEAVTVEQAQEAARLCVLHGLAVLREALGSLDRVERIVKVTGFVASVPEFHEQPRVVDAASGLLVEIFGEAGRHARSAVGVAALPRNSPVEIEFIVGIREDG